MNPTETVSFLEAPEALLESLLPGYSFFARLVKIYLHANASIFLLASAALLVACMYFFPVLWTRPYHFLLPFASSVQIRYNDDIYKNVMCWVSQLPELSTTQDSIAGTEISFVSPWDKNDQKTEQQTELSEEEIVQFEKDEREFWIKIRELKTIQPIHYTPAPPGIHFFRYRGTLFGFCRQPYKEAGSPWTDHREKLYIKTNNNRVRISQGLKDGPARQWMNLPSKMPRPLSTIIIDPLIKNALVDELTDFLHPRTRSWYQKRGIPYRRGYLFQGPPGTGKSSLCLAIASLIGLEIRLFLSLPEKCLVLFEDVDQAGIENRNISESLSQVEDASDNDRSHEFPDSSDCSQGGLSLSEILNIIDGVSAQEGRILIMTTNDPGSLDKALQRPGRVDRVFPFHFATPRDIKEIFLTFFVRPSDHHYIVDPHDMRICCSLEPASSSWSLNDIVQLSESFASALQK
ncbi:BCS1 and AAA domain-containing protein [Aspergillus homomorphus CBS 101889]|uniref:P-loop containing nucleoside triphosphate hydrolase protein n=1 Tax=Aspergillus homomorphus (strain CBS 101889) TaxID=1450537 RepID=A0A395I2N3_ASPHC|nr:P-loop containing nucleoside triphosphate hydrolase protein [Aspergillus homomorphus CBS 101889]RAL14197.1 P-loop containing nucleoside triphosphate hydrolase protein [Aspergillus homomorphus CBS 101889]